MGQSICSRGPGCILDGTGFERGAYPVCLGCVHRAVSSPAGPAPLKSGSSLKRTLVEADCKRVGPLAWCSCPTGLDPGEWDATHRDHRKGSS